MTYRKYIKRGGKIFGPYYCESYRDENGNVKTRFISGPTKKDKIREKTRKLPYKKLFLILSIILGIFLLLLIGNLNYNKITGKATERITGKVVGQELVSSADIKIAEKIAKKELVSNVNIREHVDLEMKKSFWDIIFFRKAKKMEFDVPEGEIKLSFDLLNYSEFVKEKKEEKIIAENFDIDVRESAEKYKWGYKVKLTDLNFIAKIDVKSIESIKIIDTQTLKIGNNYLSFADLAEQGYILSINKPVVLEEINISIVNVTEVNVSEINITEKNITEVREIEEVGEEEQVPEYINVSYCGDDVCGESLIADLVLGKSTQVTISGIKYNIKLVGVTNTYATVSVNGINTVITEGTSNVVNGLLVFVKEASEVVVSGSPDYINRYAVLVLGENEESCPTDCISQPPIAGGGGGGGGEPGPFCGNSICDSGEDCASCSTDCGKCPPVCGNGVCDSGEDCASCSTDCGSCGTGDYTGRVIYPTTSFLIKVFRGTTGFFVNGVRGVTGFIINGVKGITGLAIEENTVSIYIEKDFTNIREIGDIINLDPFLIIIISKAEHLDENRDFVSDIYEEVKELDNNWSEIINDNEYVRVTFYQNLTKDNDITIYARANNELSEIAVYRENDNNEIARFTNITQENWYKVYLSNLNEGESYDVFDLKVLGSIEFDYIVDPQANVSENVTQCGTLDSHGVYYMNQSITNDTLTGNCININTQNITLDCNGFSITSNASYSGVYSNQTNTTIKNCNITMGSIGYGIYLYNADDSYIFNNILNSQSRGIILENTDNTILTNITANNNSFGIQFSTSKNNILTNITLINNTHTSINLGSIDGLDSNNFTNVVITTSYDTGNFGAILLSTSGSNVFRDSSFATTEERLIRMPGGSPPTNNTFINVSYNSSKEYFDAGWLDKLIRKWYYQTYVNDTAGNSVSNANVRIYDKNNNLIINTTTNSSGWSNREELIDYINNQGIRTYYSNYTIYAYNSTYVGSVKYNATSKENKLNDVITISEGTFVEPNRIVSECGTLSEQGRNYILTQSLSTTGDCLVISANNITLDMQGYNITGDGNIGSFYSGVRDYGVEINGYNYTTIKSGYIYNFSEGIYSTGYNGNFTNLTIFANSDFGAMTTIYGIYISGGGNNYITNSNISVSNPPYDVRNSRGIYLYISSGNTITDTTLMNSLDTGIYLYSSSSNSLTNIVAVSNNRTGIVLDSSSNNNILTNITANSNNNAGITLSSSSNNILTSITAINNSYGISFFYSSSNNNITDSNISANKVYDVLLYYSGSSTNNIFLNTSGLSKESVASGSSLFRKWYYKAHVVDNSSTPVANASVIAYNISGSATMNLTTNATGWTPIGHIIDYINSGGTRTYQSEYIISANSNRTLWDSHDYNATQQENNLNDSFIVEIDVTPPVLSGTSYTATTTSATITWITNEGSNSSLTYWSSPAITIGNNNFVKSHSLTLTGLSSNTTYSYNYTSCDFAGNCNTSLAYSFTTAVEGVVTGSGGGGTYCISNWKCSLWSNCIDSSQSRTCYDENKCGTTSGKPEETRTCVERAEEKPVETETPLARGTGACISNWKCENWSDCEIVYRYEDLVEGNTFLQGEQKRACKDLAKCYYNKLETKKCDTKIPVIVKKIEKCSKNYLEVRDEKGILISRLELIGETYQKLNIQMLLYSEYCPYCYDSIKNYNEDEIDCVYDGDSCPLCKEEMPTLKAYPLILIILSILILLLLIIVLILSRKIHKKRKEKGIEKIKRFLKPAEQELREIRKIPLKIEKERTLLKKFKKRIREILHEIDVKRELVKQARILKNIGIRESKIVKKLSEKEIKSLEENFEAVKKRAEKLGEKGIEKSTESRKKILKIYKKIFKKYAKNYKKLLKLRKRIIKKHRKIIRKERKGKISFRKRQALEKDIEVYKRGIERLRELKNKVEELDKRYGGEEGKKLRLKLQDDIKKLKEKIKKRRGG